MKKTFIFKFLLLNLCRDSHTRNRNIALSPAISIPVPPPADSLRNTWPSCWGCRRICSSSANYVSSCATCRALDAPIYLPEFHQQKPGVPADLLKHWTSFTPTPWHYSAKITDNFVCLTWHSILAPFASPFVITYPSVCTNMMINPLRCKLANLYSPRL